MQPIPVNPIFFFASLAILFWCGYWKANHDAEEDKKLCAQHEHPPYPGDESELCYCGARRYPPKEPQTWTN